MDTLEKRSLWIRFHKRLDWWMVPAIAALATVVLLVAGAVRGSRAPVTVSPPTCADEGAYWRAHGRPDLETKTCGGQLLTTAADIEQLKTDLEALERRVFGESLALEETGPLVSLAERLATSEAALLELRQECGAASRQPADQGQ